MPTATPSCTISPSVDAIQGYDRGEISGDHHVHLADFRDAVHPGHSVLPEPLRHQDRDDDQHARLVPALRPVRLRRSGRRSVDDHPVVHRLRHGVRLLQHLRLAVRGDTERSEDPRQRAGPVHGDDQRRRRRARQFASAAGSSIASSPHADGSKNWHGIWITFSLYALAMAVLFVPLFKHKHSPASVRELHPEPKSGRERRMANAAKSSSSAATSRIRPGSSNVFRASAKRCARIATTPARAARASIRPSPVHARASPTAFVGALGQRHVRRFRASSSPRDENMPCRWQIHDDQPTATSSITVNAQGENQIAMIFGANEHLDPDLRARAGRSVRGSRKPCCCSSKTISDALGAALDTWRAPRPHSRHQSCARTCRSLMRRCCSAPTSSRRTKPNSRCCSNASRHETSTRRRSRNTGRRHLARPRTQARRRDCRRHPRRARMFCVARRRTPRRCRRLLSAASGIGKGRRQRPAPAMRSAAALVAGLVRFGGTPVPRRGDPRQSSRRNVDRDRRHGAGDGDL